MANSLFEFQSAESFPEGITNIELSDLQKAVLKLLAFMDHPRSRTEIKQLAGEIITSVPEYKMVTKSSVSACIEFFVDQGFFVNYNNGIGLHPKFVKKLLPLAGSHLQLINIAYNIEKSRGYKSNDEARLKLAILSRDIHKIKEELFGTGYYYYRPTTERLWEALSDLGDLSLISPLLPDFEEHYRTDFLNKLPFYLSYHFLEQWDTILLSQEPALYQEAVFNYLSCAHLILPRQQVVNISTKLNADPNSLFFLELLQGNTEKAVMMASSWLQTLQEKNGHRRKELPGAFGILYAIVLLVSGEPDNLPLAATFVRSVKKQLPTLSRENNNPFKQFAEILLMFINHRIGKMRVDRNTIYHAYQCPIHQYFLTVVLSWLGKPLESATIPFGVSEKEEMEYRASGLKFENEQDANSKKRLK